MCWVIRHLGPSMALTPQLTNMRLILSIRWTTVSCLFIAARVCALARRWCRHLVVATRVFCCLAFPPSAKQKERAPYNREYGDGTNHDACYCATRDSRG